MDKINRRKEQAKEDLDIKKKFQGLNTSFLATKKNFMESLAIPDYILHFGKGSQYCNCIEEIKFTRDVKFSFVCIFYVGIIK